MTKQPDHIRRCFPQGRSKIARLPKEIREQLNAHLRDGWAGTKLIAWLHEQPAVQRLLKKRFHGKPVNHQNLTDWRHGRPYADWVRDQERKEMLHHRGT